MASNNLAHLHLFFLFSAVVCFPHGLLFNWLFFKWIYLAALDSTWLRGEKRHFLQSGYVWRLFRLSLAFNFFKGHPGASFTQSHTPNWQQIDLLCCFETVDECTEHWVNCVSTAGHPYLYLCLQSFHFGSQKAFKSERRASKNSWASLRKNTHNPLIKKRERKREQEGANKREIIKKKKGVTVSIFKPSGCCGC